MQDGQLFLAFYIFSFCGNVSEPNTANGTEEEIYANQSLERRSICADNQQIISPKKVCENSENLENTNKQTKKLDLKEAFATYYFMIEEIGYYYASVLNWFGDALSPIFEAGSRVMADIDKTFTAIKQGKDAELAQRSETESEELKAKYGYLFE